MTVDGKAVANFVLDFCDERRRTVTNLSLQKIIYFCHVWSLIQFGTPLIRHRFEAWQFGPVLDYLYREFRRFHDQPITGRASRIDPKTGSRETVPYDFEQSTMALLTDVVDFYTQLKSADLVTLSHAKGGPWDNAWNHSSLVNPGMAIDENLIIQYYSTTPPPFSVQ